MNQHGGEMKMKKITALLATALLLAACGSSSEPEKTGHGETAKDNNGDYATADIKVKGDDVVEITLDETKEGKSKKELKEEYNMKAASSIQKEWYEQVEFLENYIEENGLDAVKLDDAGYPAGDDVKAGFTINLTNLMNAANAAKEAAK